MRGRSDATILAIAALALMAECLARPAEALPMFGRRAAGVSCTMCHWHPNALNATGKSYLRRGVRLPGEEGAVTRADLHLSHYGSLLLRPELSDIEGGGTRFSAGDAVLWLAGPVDKRFTALAEVEFKIDDEEVEVEEVYAQMVDGSERSYFSARIGQFQPLLLLSNESGPARIPLSRPEVLSGQATNGNPFRPRSRLRGVEAGWVRGYSSWYIGLGNGPRQNETDNHMDIYVTYERELGAEGSSIGAYAYFGEAVLESGFRDSFERYGVIGNYTRSKTRLTGGFLLGSDDDPSGADLDNDGWYVQAARIVGTGLVVYLRWDEYSADRATGGEAETDGLALGVSSTPSELVRLTLEGRALDIDDVDQDSLVAQVQIAF